jgi:hypothetical protein
MKCHQDQQKIFFVQDGDRKGVENGPSEEEKDGRPHTENGTASV